LLVAVAVSTRRRLSHPTFLPVAATSNFEPVKRVQNLIGSFVRNFKQIKSEQSLESKYFTNIL